MSTFALKFLFTFWLTSIKLYIYIKQLPEEKTLKKIKCFDRYQSNVAILFPYTTLYILIQKTINKQSLFFRIMPTG